MRNCLKLATARIGPRGRGQTYASSAILEDLARLWVLRRSIQDLLVHDGRKRVENVAQSRQREGGRWCLEGSMRERV